MAQTLVEEVRILRSAAGFSLERLVDTSSLDSSGACAGDKALSDAEASLGVVADSLEEENIVLPLNAATIDRARVCKSIRDYVAWPPRPVNQIIRMTITDNMIELTDSKIYRDVRALLLDARDRLQVSVSVAGGSDDSADVGQCTAGPSQEEIEALQPRLRVTWMACQWACERKGRDLSAKDAHEFLVDCGPDEYDVQKSEHTFARYLSEARKQLSIPKNQPRHGREARSAIRPGEK
jgi:hypothetical protein